MAMGYARRNWAVLPIHQPTQRGCSCSQDECGSPAKHPKITGGLSNASMDQRVIGRWWRQWPAANVGIRTGRGSGLVVIDVDPAHGGDDSLADLESIHGALGGWQVRTGSGGEHRWFSHPGAQVRNSAGQLGAGIDVRGDGGYIIAPPSRHISGGGYSWVEARGPLPQLPDWLAERLVEPPRVARLTRPIHRAHDGSAWARTAQILETDQVRRAPEGQRNATLNRSAFCLGQIAGAGLLNEHSVAAGLVEAGVHVGLGEMEARRTVASGMRAGMAHPRAPTGAADVTATTVERQHEAIEVEI